METVEIFRERKSGVAQVVLERGGDRLTAGSAFLVPGGIVTNSHVIRAGDADVIVIRFSQMTEVEPIRIARDDIFNAIKYESSEDEWDIAYIALDEPEFEGRYRFEFADSNPVEVGHQVAFIGYPFQMENITCHVGHVSSLYEHNGVSYIQIDGSVNGGNSGGPLLELTSGRVVGIVTRANVGFVAEQFEILIATLSDNVKALGSQSSSISIGGIDPIQAVKASQIAMIQIAVNLRRSANVGIGYAFNSSHIRDAISA